MTIKLKKLLKDISFQQIKGSKEIDITGVCANSQLVAPGNLFIARKGKSVDGALYIPQAVAAGASAVITDLYDPLLNKNVTQILHPDPGAIEGLIAATYHEFPSDELFMVGITGTNGKTTTAFLVKYLLDNLDGLCGLIGTIEYIIGTHRYRATRTTPDVSSTQKMLREMVLQKCRHAVMEVTSHALDQHRVDYVDFDTAIFTNLTLDHLDYHQTMENYFLAKQKLFQHLNSAKIKPNSSYAKTSIINLDTPWSERLLGNCTGNTLTYGMQPGADLFVSNVKLRSNGSEISVRYRKSTKTYQFPLAGRFNVYNCLAAMAVALTRGFTLNDIAEVLQKMPPINGRLEFVPNALGLKIYVDFAHTDDALLNVLECLNEFKTGRLICVFGCGGNRDASKRPKMAQIAESHADIVIITSDNPRDEHPLSIAAQVAAGFKNPHQHIQELDRYRAIEIAIDMATAEDTILIAGKGHETHQIFGYKTISFDDRLVATEICEKKVARQ